MRRSPSSLVCAALFGLTLTACGGGGGGDDSSSTPGAAQGAYEGTTSSGQSHLTLVLDDDRFYTLYGQESGGMFLVEGLLQGNGKANNGSFTSSNLKDYYFDGTVASGSLSATYNPAVSLNGSVTEGSTSVTFTSTAFPSADYNYNAAANLTNITGAWTMTSLQGETIALNIQPSGTFSASSGGCTFSGTIAPRASGKNVFDVNLTFGAAPCLLPGQSASGVAIEYATGAQRELLIAGTSANRDNGTVMFGSR